MNLSLASAILFSSLLVAAPSARACGVMAKSYGLNSGGSEEAVYSMSNNHENELVVYSVGAGGTLHFADRMSTGGMGDSFLGEGLLGATDSVIVAGRCVLNVNFGSNDISTYFINSATNLEFKGTFSSGGSGPVSLASTGQTVFALNAGGNGSIQGFQLQPSCTLSPNGGAVELDQEVVPMGGVRSGILAPSQIGITPDGKVNALIKITNTGGGVGTFNIYNIEDGAVDPESLEQIPVSRVNAVPSAFEYLANGNVLVVDTMGGTPFGEGHVSLTSSVGRVDPPLASGQLLLLDSDYEVIDAADSTQFGSSWMRYNPVANIAYTANTPVGTISTFSVADDGVELVKAVAATQAFNADMLLCPDYKQLYVTSCNFSEGPSTLSVYDVTAEATDGMELMQVVDPVPGIMCNVGLALYFPNGEDVEAEVA